MQGKTLSIGLRAVLAIIAATLFVTSTWATAQEKVLHNFNNNGTDGTSPRAGLIFDAAGNLYGTTEQGGAYSHGTVFELTPAAGGGWTEQVLHNFNNNGTDGTNPYAGLIFDSAGNLYGTTAAGGGWTEKVLHSFGNSTDGQYPNGLIFDAAGNLYGTTWEGGTYEIGRAHV